MSLLSIERVSVRYTQSIEPLRGVEARLQTGRFVALVGPNGSGKSSLLRVCAGIQHPTSGHIALEGRPLHELSASERARMVGVVLTDRVQGGFLRVWEVIALGGLPYRPIRLFAGRAESHRRHDERDAVIEAARATEVESLLDRRLAELSDGERQRVMIARVLLQKPRIVLCDEATAYLDPPHQSAIFSFLAQIVRTGRVGAVVIATHNLSAALHYCNELWIVNQGSIHPLEPSDARTARAIAESFGRPAEEFDPVTGMFRL